MKTYTLFPEFVEKYFPAIVGAITERFNGKPAEQQLLHKTMLTEEYTPDLNWSSNALNHSIVAADVVSLDSSRPLKSRGSIEKAGGEISKMSVAFRKGERDITDINIMRARGTNEATIAAKIFDDTHKAIKAIDTRVEMLFLQALSTGMILVADDESNTGTGIRASFNYKDDNIKYASTDWGSTSATPDPVEDIRKLFDQASTDGNSIAHVYLSKKYLDLLRKSQAGKELVAHSRGWIVTSSTKLPMANQAAMLEALQAEFGATFHIVDSAFRVEKRDGSFATVRPWDEGAVVGVPDSVVGRLVYSTLAEETNPVAGVAYQKSGSHTLVSKYSKNDPLEEFTAADALCLPVIDGADSIYLLHADKTSAD